MCQSTFYISSNNFILVTFKKSETVKKSLNIFAEYLKFQFQHLQIKIFMKFFAINENTKCYFPYNFNYSAINILFDADY